MIRYTAKILRKCCKIFKRVSDYFGTLCTKELNIRSMCRKTLVNYTTFALMKIAADLVNESAAIVPVSALHLTAQNCYGL